MKPARPALIVAVCLALTASNLQVLAAQQPPATAQTTQTQTTPAQTPPPPDNLDRIRAAVKRPPALKVEDGQLRIYVEVIARWPSFADIAKDYDMINGPTGRSRNAMSHQEFLNMVTPKEMTGSGGIQPGEILTMALVNYVGQKIVKAGIKQIGEARSEKEIRDIRDQINRELAALRGGR